MNRRDFLHSSFRFLLFTLALFALTTCATKRQKENIQKDPEGYERFVRQVHQGPDQDEEEEDDCGFGCS